MNAALLLSLVADPALAQDCDAPVSQPRLVRQTTLAMDAFFALDTPAFRAAREQVLALAPCLSEPVQRRVMAELHRIEALHAFLDRDEAAARAHFAAAALIEPAYDARELAPEGHPILAVEAASRAEATAPAAPLQVGEGLAWWDGAGPPARVSALPGLLQTGDRYGTIVEAEWVPAGAMPTVSAQAAGRAVRVALTAGPVRTFGHQAFAGEAGRAGALSIGRVGEAGGVAGFLSLGLQDGVPWSEQAGWAKHAVGDVALVSGGVSVWASKVVNQVELAPEGRLGVVNARSNVWEQGFVDEVVNGAWGGSTAYLKPVAWGPSLGGSLRVAKAAPLGRVRLVVAPGVDLLLVGQPLVVGRMSLGFEHDF